MRIEDTEIKISLDIREAQSLHAILKAVSEYKQKRIGYPIALSNLPNGMFDDAKEVEMQLSNLLWLD